MCLESAKISPNLKPITKSSRRASKIEKVTNIIPQTYAGGSRFVLNSFWNPALPQIRSDDILPAAMVFSIAQSPHFRVYSQDFTEAAS